MKNALPPLDRAIAGLVTDLDERGLYEKVAICVCGEFGRTPRVNKDAGRDHWGESGFCLLGGGGIKGGVVIGSTNEKGERPKDRPIKPEDMWATLYQVLGVDKTQIVHRPPRPAAHGLHRRGASTKCTVGPLTKPASRNKDLTAESAEDAEGMQGKCLSFFSAFSALSAVRSCFPARRDLPGSACRPAGNAIQLEGADFPSFRLESTVLRTLSFFTGLLAAAGPAPRRRRQASGFQGAGARPDKGPTRPPPPNPSRSRRISRPNCSTRCPGTNRVRGSTCASTPRAG